MAELLAPVTIYGRMAAARLRSDWQYRTSFVALMISQSLVTALEFAALIMIVDLVPALGQWTRAEVAFLYALAAVPFALSDLVISPVETTSRHVQEGTFDRLPPPACVTPGPAVGPRVRAPSRRQDGGPGGGAGVVDRSG